MARCRTSSLGQLSFDLSNGVSLLVLIIFLLRCVYGSEETGVWELEELVKGENIVRPRNHKRHFAVWTENCLVTSIMYLVLRSS